MYVYSSSSCIVALCYQLVGYEGEDVYTLPYLPIVATYYCTVFAEKVSVYKGIYIGRYGRYGRYLVYVYIYVYTYMYIMNRGENRILLASRVEEK